MSKKGDRRTKIDESVLEQKQTDISVIKLCITHLQDRLNLYKKGIGKQFLDETDRSGTFILLMNSS